MLSQEWLHAEHEERIKRIQALTGEQLLRPARSPWYGMSTLRIKAAPADFCRG